MKHSILCVDDEVDNVDALERLFRRNYTVLKATSAQEALDLLAKNRVSVIISDQRMPNMTGVELLAESVKTHPDAIRILLTGYTDIESVISAINSGQIYRYVTKPWDPVDLSNAVQRAVERYELGEELKIKNVELQRANDELKTLDDSKNNFMILINHELKTPLTAILSFGDLLSETSLDDDQKLYLARIKTSAHRLQELVTDSLELVSAETGLMKVEARPLKTKALFATLPEQATTLAKSRKLQVNIDVENQDVVADEKILRNVVRRLLHNAVKFADAGSEVSISGKSVGKEYVITFTNAGQPIDDRKIRQIFKPFALNESIMNHTTGTGLGLSICQAQLRLLNSSLQFECKNGLIEVTFKIPKAG